MAEVRKVFLHNGPRSDATDPLAEDLARHYLTDRAPDVTGIELVWLLDQGQWLLVATGTIPEKEGTT